jgi:osmotically-inducible protein OsmY
MVFGLIAGELLGAVNPKRVKDAVRRLRPGERVSTDPDQLRRDLLSALRHNATTGRLDIDVRVLGDGLVEVTGTAPDERSRELAAALANSVRGTDRVINRILVSGVDVPEGSGRAARAT